MRKEQEWGDARREAANERSRAEEEREGGERKARELRESLRAKTDECMALSEAKVRLIPEPTIPPCPHPTAHACTCIPYAFANRQQVKAETALELAQLRADTSAAALRNANAEQQMHASSGEGSGSNPAAAHTCVKFGKNF